MVERTVSERKLEVEQLYSMGLITEKTYFKRLDEIAPPDADGIDPDAEQKYIDRVMEERDEWANQEYEASLDQRAEPFDRDFRGGV